MQGFDWTSWFAYWRLRIEKDLSPFKDPGTTLEISGDKYLLDARWNARGRCQSATFTITQQGVKVQFRGVSLSYESFFSSEELADLQGLARMMLQAGPQGIFVPTQGRLLDEPDGDAGSALDLLEGLLAEAPPDRTRIVMVIGEAGAGKTRVLQELVRLQADKYLRGRASSLYIYVNAQGRALARFSEALATELQDLRARLTYHGVPAVVRAGLLVPVIDGFDELLGVGGYDDAFSSLSGFIQELDGQGQVVASARSTYYEQEFVARTNKVTALGAQSWSQEPVEILPWGDMQFREYAQKFCEANGIGRTEADGLAAQLRGVLSGATEDLRRKPLFVARTLEILIKQPGFAGGGDLLERLVDAYLERERTEKLLDRHGGALMTGPQLRALFSALAEEMWIQETRELDTSSVTDVAEVYLEPLGVPEPAREIVRQRISQLAFLVPSQRSRGPAGVAFEHEMFFAFFLSGVLAGVLSKGDPSSLRSFLYRSVLPFEVADAVVPASNWDLQALFSLLGECARQERVRGQQVRENAGRVAQAALRSAGARGALIGLRIADVIIPGRDLGGVELRGCELTSVEMRRVDLSRTRFIDCRCGDLLLQDVTIEPGRTRLEISGLDVSSQVIGLQVRVNGVARAVYEPNERREALVACGAAVSAEPLGPGLPERAVPKQYMDLLGRLAHCYGRANPVCTSDDWNKDVFRSEKWPLIEGLLEKHGVVRREVRSTKGPSKVFLRRQYLPDQIMAGLDRAAPVPRQIREFWDELEQKAH